MFADTKYVRKFGQTMRSAYFFGILPPQKLSISICGMQ